MADVLTVEQLKNRRAAVKKTLESMVRAGAGADEFSNMEKYLKLLDKRIERAEQVQTKVR